MTVHLVYETTASGNQVYFETLRSVLEGDVVASPLPARTLPRLRNPLRGLAAGATLATNLELLPAFRRGHPHRIGVVHHVDRPLGQPGLGGMARTAYYRHKRRLLRRGARYADAVVAVSRATQVDLEALGIASRVVYPGIETDRFSPAAAPASRRGPHRLLFVGNPTFRKGYDLLPRIVELLGPGFELTVVAGGRDEATPVPGARMLGQLSRDDLVATYRATDCLLQPTRLEGFGYTVAEAMACGKPVISTRTASIPELVEEGRGGHLCPMGDAQAYADAVRRLFGTAGDAARFGEHNRERAVARFGLGALRAGWGRVVADVQGA